MSSSTSLLNLIAENRGVFWAATAVPALLFRHNRSVYHRSREILQADGGPLATMRQLHSWLVQEVGKRLTRAVGELADGSHVVGLDGEPVAIPIDETIDRILTDSSAILADSVELRALRDRRRIAAQRVRALARILQWGVWAVPTVAIGSFALAHLAPEGSRDWMLIPPALALVTWITVQLALVVFEWVEDRLDDDFARIQERHAGVG